MQFLADHQKDSAKSSTYLGLRWVSVPNWNWISLLQSHTWIHFKDIHLDRLELPHVNLQLRGEINAQFVHYPCQKCVEKRQFKGWD